LDGLVNIGKSLQRVKRADSSPKLSCRLQDIHGMSATAMHDTLSLTPPDFSAYLGYNIVRSGYENQSSSLGHLLSCIANPAIR
jgi:hypothetical protein